MRDVVNELKRIILLIEGKTTEEGLQKEDEEQEREREREKVINLDKERERLKYFQSEYFDNSLPKKEKEKRLSTDSDDSKYKDKKKNDKKVYVYKLNHHHTHHNDHHNSKEKEKKHPGAIESSTALPISNDGEEDVYLGHNHFQKQHPQNQQYQQQHQRSLDHREENIAEGGMINFVSNSNSSKRNINTLGGCRIDWMDDM
jgi:hypothetical protein